MKRNTHVIPNLRRASDPPDVIVIEGWCESIPLEEQLLVKELIDLDPDRFTRSFWERQFHIDLSGTLSTTVGLVESLRTMFNVSSRLGVLSISSVPKISASLLPPLMARSLQYALIFTSPPSHSRKSRAVCTKGRISTYQDFSARNIPGPILRYRTGSWVPIPVVGIMMLNNGDLTSNIDAYIQIASRN